MNKIIASNGVSFEINGDILIVEKEDSIFFKTSLKDIMSIEVVLSRNCFRWYEELIRIDMKKDEGTMNSKTFSVFFKEVEGTGDMGTGDMEITEGTKRIFKFLRENLVNNN